MSLSGGWFSLCYVCYVYGVVAVQECEQGAWEGDVLHIKGDGPRDSYG